MLNNPLALTDPAGLSVRHHHHGAHSMDEDESDCDMPGADECGNDDDGNDDGGNDDTCDAQCQQQQQLEQAEDAAYIALLNPLCDFVIGGDPGEGGQILANLSSANSLVNIEVGQPVDVNNQPIQGANASTNSQTVITADGSQVNGAITTINPNGQFFNGYTDPSGNSRFGLTDQQNQVVTLLHEVGHEIDFLANGVANGSNTMIVPDGPNTTPGASLDNSALVANNCT